jgi:hypothetical protein
MQSHRSGDIMPRIYVVLLLSGLATGMVGQPVLADEAHAAPAKPAAPAADGGTPKAAKAKKAKAHSAPDASDTSTAAAPATKPAKRKKPSPAPDDTLKPAASTPSTPVVAIAPVAAKPAPVTAAPPTKPQTPNAPATICALEEREQPRGGRLDVIGNGFGQAPVVRIAQRPARMIERRTDRISVQVPPDSNGGPVTLQTEGRSADCGTLVIIGKNR